MPLVQPKIGQKKVRNEPNVISLQEGVQYFQGLVTSTNALYMLRQGEKMLEIGGIKVGNTPTDAYL